MYVALSSDTYVLVEVCKITEYVYMYIRVYTENVNHEVQQVLCISST